MSEFDKRLQRQVLTLQVGLYACSARLAADTDGEALHDLRIALRRLSSLLRPLCHEPLCQDLEQHVAALSSASGAIRDLEVLVAELEAQGLPEAASQRRARLADDYVGLLAGLPLRYLLERLDVWPEDCRKAQCRGGWQARGKDVGKYLDKQARKLARALRDPAHDRHRLRLLIKRLRYCAEAWPGQGQLDERTLQALRRAQATLGDWHDHLQWLQRLPAEADLAPCAEVWKRRLDSAEQEAELALQVLAELFPQSPE